MENLFLAKSNPKETIIEHTEKLLEQYEKLKEVYPNIKNLNWELLYDVCLYHDIGKMNTKFQNKIMKKLDLDLLEDYLEEIDEIPHGYLSGAFIPLEELEMKFSEDEIRIFYESIYYHHNREKLQGKRLSELRKIIKEDLSLYNNNFFYEKLIQYSSLNTKFMKYLRFRILKDEEDNKELDTDFKYIMTKGLLNKIDYAASSGIEVEFKNTNLQQCTEKSIEQFGLNDLQKFMKNNQNNNIIIKASTGIGKTEGALIWIGNNKGFFTLPLRVSINSIYDRIIDKKKIGFKKELTALLHSDTVSEYMKRDDKQEIDKNYLDTTKQLSLPLTICTVDQLIGFIFKYEGFELKLATLSYSKLVIDEIQMYSPEMVAYLVIALKQINQMGGKFAIVTATFPPIFQYFMNYVGIKENVDYIMPEKGFLKMKEGKPILRHKIKVHKENINVECFCNLAENKKVLVIVNTVKIAQSLYKKLKEYNNNIKVNMFHSKFIKKDRAKKEHDIFEMGKLDCKETGIWITTQVVEASLDIDFDVLYTELSDVAGLLQRMGRVYRNRTLDKGEANVHVFVGKEKLPSGIRNSDKSIIDIDIFNKSKEAIMLLDNEEIDEKKKLKLVDDVYSLENLKESKYFRKIQKTIIDFNDIEAFEITQKDVKLRNILSVTIIPKGVYKENKSEIDENIEKLQKNLEYKDRVKIKDYIMKYTLSIPQYEFDNIKKKGININSLKLNDYEQIYIFPFNYSFERGLERPENINAFDEDQFL